MDFIPSPPAVQRIFQSITGVGMVGLFMGFSVCLFDLSTVPQCVDYAQYATNVLKGIGDHIVKWFTLVFQEVFKRY